MSAQQTCNNGYVFVSDTNVSFVYDRIPLQILQRIGFEMDINLRLLASSFRNRAVEARITKSRIVDTFVRNNLGIGTIRHPDQFIRGEMKLRWGVVPERAVYFWGRSGEVSLALGGSLDHLMDSPSELPHIGIKMQEPRGLLSDGDRSGAGLVTLVGSDTSTIDSNRTRIADINEGATLDPKARIASIVKSCNRDFCGPEGKFKFLARTLFNHNDALIASPLYVQNVA